MYLYFSCFTFPSFATIHQSSKMRKSCTSNLLLLLPTTLQWAPASQASQNKNFWTISLDSSLIKMYPCQLIKWPASELPTGCHSWGWQFWVYAWLRIANPTVYLVYQVWGSNNSTWLAMVLMQLWGSSRWSRSKSLLDRVKGSLESDIKRNYLSNQSGRSWEHFSESENGQKKIHQARKCKFANSTH